MSGTSLLGIAIIRTTSKNGNNRPAGGLFLLVNISSFWENTKPATRKTTKPRSVISEVLLLAGFPRIVKADLPGMGETHYLVDANYDFIPEVKRFLDYKRAVGRAPTTIEAYCARLRYLYQFLTQRGLSVLAAEGRKQADSSDLVAFVMWLCNPYREAGNVEVIHRESPLQASTVNMILQAVANLYQYLVRQHEIAESPVRYVDIHRSQMLKDIDLLTHTRRGKDATTARRMDLKLKTPKRLPKVVGEADFAAFVGGIHMGGRPQSDPCGFRDRLICVLLKESGLRIGELLGMRLEDIEYSQGGIHVRFRADNANRARAKAGYEHDRFVHLSPDVMGILDIYLTEVWLDASPDHDYLWIVLRPNARNRDGAVTFGQPLTYKAVSSQFRHYSEQSEVRITPHMLRHTHATGLVRSFTENGQPVDWKFIQERLGHASVVTTMMIYTHLNDQDRKQGYDNYLERRENVRATRYIHFTYP
jgi:integrase/recombinase XerD